MRDLTADDKGRDFATVMFTVSYFFVWGFVIFALLHLLLEVVGPALYDTKPWKNAAKATPPATRAQHARMV